MNFHVFGQKGVIKLPEKTNVQDLKTLASFNRIIKNYIKMEKIFKRINHKQTKK